MPDSQPTPPWGLAYDERDLDALLSGDTAATPAALRPIESTLAALRAGATGRELSREAAARAAFRAFAGASPAVAPPAWTAGAEPAVTGHTLILPALDGQPQPAPRRRHRHRRSAAGGSRRPGIVVTGVAAAALIVVAAAVTGALTGSIGELPSFGRQPASASASARATVQPPGSQGVLVTGAARAPSPKPSASESAPATPRPTVSPASLCREYFQSLSGFDHPMAGGAPAWVALRGQLGRLAGGPFKIDGYCFHVLAGTLGGNGGWSPAGGDAGGAGGTGPADTGTGGGAASGGIAGGSTGGQGSGTAGQPSVSGGQTSRTADQGR
jgi:hypothetical protein